MLHRTNIRHFTAEMLTATGWFNEVFQSRETVIVREQLPCCKVWTPREGGPNISIGVPELRSTTDLVVQIVMEGSEDLDLSDEIDARCWDVMILLVESPAWQKAFERLVSMETEIETNTEGEVRTVTATITFVVQHAYVFITRIRHDLETLDVTVETTEPEGAGARVILGTQP
jgi:hypothetical protein